MRYSLIAEVLEKVSGAQRSQKAELLSSFLSTVGPKLLCPSVRLLLGELWPPWEDREMGIGPEHLSRALEEISEEDISLLGERLSEVGLLAEAALLRKGQRPLMDGRLEASMVYEGLRQISLLRGPQSMHRKAAILRGLLLEASPLEGKYIARTALRRMLAGIGPGTMISAISMAFGRDQQEVRGAYAIMPDMGLLAELALSHELGRISIRPGVPIVPMRASRGDARTPGRFLPMYPGIRVQVHRAGRQVRAFTSRLRDVTALLRGMAQDIPDKEMIIDAHLIGFRDGEICSQEEMLRYIKRERLARRSTIQPAILAYDLIYLDGMDLTGRGYEKRRRMLEELLGQPKPLPFQGISPANEWLILEREVVAELLGQVRGAGGRMLVERDPEAPYLPGRRERGDLILVGGR